jgi:hypothetical protein
MINTTVDEIGFNLLLGNEGRSDHIYFAKRSPQYRCEHEGLISNRLLRKKL